MLNDIAPITFMLDATINSAMRALNEYGARIILVADENLKLLGTVTDGDIRRGLLSGLTLNDILAKVMNVSPRFLPVDTPRVTAHEIMLKEKLSAIPYVDENCRLIGVEILDDISTREDSLCPVLLMAGGFGKRLGDLTKDIPKPMLPLGSKPIMEYIIDDFAHQGFKKFYISTHFKSNLIKDYFKDGSYKKIAIEYIEENEPLGTAGAIYFLKDKISDCFIIMNADLMVHLDFKNLVEFHRSQGAMVTMCVRQDHHQVPFGVVELRNGLVQEIVEKPIIVNNVSAGIYCISRQVLDLVVSEKYIDMPDLLRKIIERQESVLAFPLHENWVDIGRKNDYEIAKKACL